MNRKFKLLMIIVIIFAIFSFIFFYGRKASSYIVGNNPYISYKDAKLLANQIIEKKKNLKDSSWNNSTIINEALNLYDLKGNVTMYLFRLKTDKINKGFILVNASANAPSVEAFSYSGNFYLDSFLSNESSLKLEPDDKILYLDNYSFIICRKNSKGTLTYLDVKTNRPIDEVKVKEYFAGNIISNKDEKAIENLESLRKNSRFGFLSRFLNSSSPNNSAYENNKTSSSLLDGSHEGFSSNCCFGVLSFNYKIFTLDDYDGFENHCGPVACTNLIYYFSHYYPSAKDLYSLWDNDVFNNLYEYLKTDIYNTTLDKDIITGLFKYAKSKGITVSDFKSSDGDDWSFFKDNLDKDIPIVVLVNDDKKYKDHFFLAVGYESLGDDNYLRIIDGFSVSPDVFYKFKGNIVSAKCIYFE